MRLPRAAEASVRWARQASSVGSMSEMGEAVATFPAKHATFRIWVLANQRSMTEIARAASPSQPGRALPPAAAQASSTAERGAQPPMVIPEGESVIAVSSATAEGER